MNLQVDHALVQQRHGAVVADIWIRCKWNFSKIEKKFAANNPNTKQEIFWHFFFTRFRPCWKSIFFPVYSLSFSQAAIFNIKKTRHQQCWISQAFFLNDIQLTTNQPCPPKNKRNIKSPQYTEKQFLPNNQWDMNCAFSINIQSKLKVNCIKNKIKIGKKN